MRKSDDTRFFEQSAFNFRAAGAPGRTADVGLRADRIAAVGDLSAAEDHSFSYEALAYISGSDERVFISEGYSGTSEANVTLRQISSTFRIRIENNASDEVYVDGGSTYTTGTLHHIVGTCDGSTIRLYVDGSSTGTPATAPPPPTTLNKTYLLTRRYAGAFAYWGIGGLATARIYSKALSAAEVLQNPTYPRPVSATCARARPWARRSGSPPSSRSPTSRPRASTSTAAPTSGTAASSCSARSGGSS